jgi:hypothetical protein
MLTPMPNGQWPDDVKRVKDELDMHAVAGSFGFVAIALADGSPLDHTAYPTWNDAVKAAKWDRDNFMFPEIQPDGIPYREAAAILEYARVIHSMGYRIPDPGWEHGEATQMPRTAFDRIRAAGQLKAGKPIVGPNVPYGNLPRKAH